MEPKPVFSPVEVMEIALGGADAFIKNHPDLEGDRLEAALQIREDERKERQEGLSKVIKKYRAARNILCGIEQHWDEEDGELYTEKQEPTIDSNGYIKIQTDGISFSGRDLKMFGYADRAEVSIQENDTGLVTQVLLTFKV